MRKAEHDFLVWTSFPSSAKLISDEVEDWVRWPSLPKMFIVPGSKVKVTVNAKREGTTPTSRPSHFTLTGFDSTGVFKGHWLWEKVPEGPFDWKTFSWEKTVPADVVRFGGQAAGGVGTTWFDDLKIYMKDVLIYSDDFSKWDPLIGAGVGAPIGGVAGYLLKEPLGPMVSEVVGAVVGGAVGGGVGLLTAMGLVPQIPIPSLGAAPEEPGAPMRLGKYQITG